MKRLGFTIVEIAAAIAVLAVCVLLFAQLTTLISSERIRDRTRQTAVDQLHNVIELLVADDFDSSDFDKSTAEYLIERSLPEGKITFGTKQIDTGSVLLTITVSWNDGGKHTRREASMFRLLTPKE